jgi:hypothetical protein
MRTLVGVDDDGDPPVVSLRRMGVVCVLEQFEQKPPRVLVGGMSGRGAQLRGGRPHIGRGELLENLVGVRNDLIAWRQARFVPVVCESNHQQRLLTNGGTDTDNLFAHCPPPIPGMGNAHRARGHLQRRRPRRLPGSRRTHTRTTEPDELIDAPSAASDERISILRAIDPRFDQRLIAMLETAAYEGMVLWVSALSRISATSTSSYGLSSSSSPTAPQS